jgi:Rrf2 family protein
MQLTRAGEYSIRCLLYLAGQPAGAVVSSRQVEDAMDIPPHFLGKIAQRLARAGLLAISQGAQGGLSLARPAQEITLRMAVEAAEGVISLNKCLLSADSCGRSSMCAVHQVWHQATLAITQVLDQADFATLARQNSGPATADADCGEALPGSRKTPKLARIASRKP